MKWLFRWRKTITARNRPFVTPDEQHSGWEIVLWLGEPFDHTIPFRATLDRIVELLGGPDAAEIELPPYDENEDFAHGTLRLGVRRFRIYYEYSLGYLSLYGPDRAPLEELARRLSPNVKVRLV